MNDPDGLALMFWLTLIGFAALVAAGGVEWLLSRPSRRWVRRLRDLERARCDWRARVIETQHFWREDRP